MAPALPLYGLCSLATRSDVSSDEEVLGPLTDGVQHDALSTQVYSSPAMVIFIGSLSGKKCCKIVSGDTKAFSARVSAHAGL